MKLKKHINIKENFYSSVNISYDMGNQYMIDNYIPTTYSIDIIEEILLSVDNNSKDRARILVGAYGKGKSHILLVVLSILSKVDNTDYSKILKNIKMINPDLEHYINSYLNSDKKLLPVIIEKNYNSLEQSFLYALNESLKLNGLEKLMPKTFYTSAIKTIEMWEENYKETYRSLEEMLSLSLEEFIKGLQNFNLDYYLKFKEIYPLLTSGSEFDPLLNLSVIDHYTEVADRIKDYGYTGIFLVYDEFSKYLESSINKISYSDLKLLQDFAELCNRSVDPQLYITLVTHKNISNYINGEIRKEKIDGWKAISGRFKHTYIKTDTYKEMYQLISAAIIVDPKFKNYFQKTHKEVINNINENKLLIDLFKKENILLHKISEECYPLHPLTTYMLPRVSIKLGQNERTLFSFLTSKENNSVISIIDKNNSDNLRFIAPTYLFDFFEISILESNYRLKPYKSYRIAKKIIDEMESSNFNKLFEDILKLLILIYIIDEYEKLAPTRKNIVMIMNSLGYSSVEVEEALEDLIVKNHIFHQISNDYLLIKEDIGINLEEKINDKTEKIKIKKPIEDIFKEVLINKYMYPLRYNSNFEITRYFSIDFIDINTFINGINWEEDIKKSQADGKIYIILVKTDEDILKVKKSLNKNKKINNKIIFIINKEYNNDIFMIYRYYAVLKLMEKSKKDRLLFDEYRLYLSDLKEVVNNTLNSFLLPELDKSYYIHNNKVKNIQRRSQLTMLLSEICEEYYSLTPVVNNETINKNYLSTSAYNSRNRLLDAILNNNREKENLGLEGNRQEVSIMRSTLVQTGILKNIDGKTIFDLNVKDKNMRCFLEHIENFVLDKNNAGKRNFASLYEVLVDKKYKIAMKTGTIPIYLAVVIRMYNKDLIISNEDEELDLTPELLESINDNPDKYYIENLYWNKDKIEYLDGLWEVFREFDYFTSKDFNKISQVTDAMNSWYMSLSKYAKECCKVPYVDGESIKFDEIEEEKIYFINSLKLGTFKPQYYIFKEIPLIYGEERLDVLLSSIKESINLYNNLDKNLIEVLKLYTKRVFLDNNISKESLTSIIKNWTDSLNSTVKNYVFSGTKNKILNHLLNINSNEDKFIYDLGKVVTGLRLEDWDRDLICKFTNEIILFKKDIEEFADKGSEKLNSTDTYKIQFGAEEAIKTYKKVDYGARADLLYNQIKSSLEMMGEALSQEEKRQVILDILYELS